MILDAKRGDMGNTSAAYARAAFDTLQADAMTLHPYMGREALDPFLSAPTVAVSSSAAPRIPARASLRT